MHKSATKCNEIIGKWCKNKHGASKIIDTFETYQALPLMNAVWLWSIVLFASGASLIAYALAINLKNNIDKCNRAKLLNAVGSSDFGNKS
jgi:hypothetical protein